MSRRFLHWARGAALVLGLLLWAHEGSGEEKVAPAAVKIHDTVVFTLKEGLGSVPAAERARRSSEALTRAVRLEGAPDTKVAPEGETLVVYVGTVPIVALGPEDARAAGQETLDAHAAAVAASVSAAVSAEKKRSAIAETVFSLSLLVFFGLIAVYVIRKAGDLADSIRKWMVDNPDRITGLRVQSHEVVGPTALRGALLVALILGRVVAQLGVLYVWLVFAFSLFDATRPLTERLTGIVIAPLSGLAGRVAASLPLAVVAAVSGVALYVLLRFVQLFFEGVARRQTTLPWLPADLAAPTSVLLRIGIVVTALVFAAPVVTGDSEGAFSRTGSVALLTLGIASTPLLATIVLGALVVYGRRVRVGQHAELGGRAGRVRAVGLFDVRLTEPDGTETRVPHFLSLTRPTRILGDRPRILVRIAVSTRAPLREVRTVLGEAVAALGEKTMVELAHLDAEAAEFSVTLAPSKETTESDVRLALAEALGKGGYELARSPAGRST